MHDAIQRDQPFRAEYTQHLREELGQRLFIINTEVGKGVMINWLQSAEPLKAWFILTLPLNLPSAANTPAVGVQPKSNISRGSLPGWPAWPSTALIGS
jgi:hypothetical protein